MRLFAALAVAPAAREHLLSALGSAAGALQPARWHLTLAFYGTLPTRRLADLQTRLARCARRTAGLELSLGGAGIFGGADRGVLWCGVQGDLDRLRRLAASSAAAGGRVGALTPARPYRPHLTLARLRGRDPAAALAILANYHGPPWAAGELILVRSVLGPEPRYLTVASFPLGG